MKLQENKRTILEHALEKDEHHGRLRGVGSQLTKTTYFRVPRGKNSNASLVDRREWMKEKEKNAEQELRIARLEAAIFKTDACDVDIDEKGSWSVISKPHFKDEKLHEQEDITKPDLDEVDMLDPDVQLLDKKAYLQVYMVLLLYMPFELLNFKIIVLEVKLFDCNGNLLRFLKSKLVTNYSFLTCRVS